jgi:hypothetical protein
MALANPLLLLESLLSKPFLPLHPVVVPVGVKMEEEKRLTVYLLSKLPGYSIQTIMSPARQESRRGLDIRPRPW